MYLSHPFSTDTREIFRYHQQCYKCGRNANAMLEIHHICGRKKHEQYLDSVLNASVLCDECHEHIDGSNDERIFLITRTAHILRQENYLLKENDCLFIYTHAEKFGLTWQQLTDIISK